MMTEYKFTIAERDEVFTFEKSEPAPIPFGLSAPIQIVSREKYEGPYEITPTSESQTIHASGLFMKDDITIDPIPSNYGLISWNGSTLTVS